MQTVLVVLVCALVTANVAASIVIVRSEVSTRLQKRLQLCLIWFVPAVGVGVALLCQRLERRPAGPEAKQAGLDDSEIDVGRGTSHDAHD